MKAARMARIGFIASDDGRDARIGAKEGEGWSGVWIVDMGVVLGGG